MEQSKKGGIVSDEKWKEYIKHIGEELDWFHKETSRVLKTDEYSPETKHIIIESYRATMDRRIERFRKDYLD